MANVDDGGVRWSGLGKLLPEGDIVIGDNTDVPHTSQPLVPIIRDGGAGSSNLLMGNHLHTGGFITFTSGAAPLQVVELEAPGITITFETSNVRYDGRSWKLTGTFRPDDELSPMDLAFVDGVLSTKMAGTLTAKFDVELSLEMLDYDVKAGLTDARFNIKKMRAQPTVDVERALLKDGAP